MVLYKRYVLFILYEKYDFNFIKYIPQSGMCPIKVQTEAEGSAERILLLSDFNFIQERSSAPV